MEPVFENPHNNSYHEHIFYNNNKENNMNSNTINN